MWKRTMAWVAMALAGWALSSAASLGADPCWHRDFVLQDAMQIYDFPEQWVGYPVDFPAGTVRRSELSLLNVTSGVPVPAAFQLCDAVERDGFLTHATVGFRTDLPRGGQREFRLMQDVAAATRPAEAGVTVEDHGDEAVLAGNLLRVRVPGGRHVLSSPLPLSKTPAPVIAIGRGAAADRSLVTGSFRAPGHLLVLSWEGAAVERGPLRAVWRVSYRLAGGRRYTVDVTLQKNENYAGIDERIEGFRSADNADLCLDYTAIDPDTRQAMSNGGYGSAHGTIGYAFSGGYADHADAEGKLPLELGLNTPNSLGVMRSTAFWKDQGDDALILSLDRLRLWQTERRYVWYQSRGPGNLNFFGRDGRKFLLTRLEGRRRLWAIGLIPREQMVNAPHLRDPKKWRKQVAGPEVRLFQKLGDFNLDRVKDWVFDWDETLDCRLFKDAPVVTYDQWVQKHALVGKNEFLSNIINCYWDMSGPCGAVSFRDQPAWFGEYERSRSTWTEAQRRHVRAILLFMTYSSEDDNNLPHHSMLAGHPNFISDVKQVLPLACAVFPTHPQAPLWKASFMDYYREWLSTYQRADDPVTGAIGGRWTENIACYSGQALQGLLHSAHAMRAYDGTDLADHPAVRNWINWYMNAMTSPNDGVRVVPPEGAHAVAFEIGNHHGFRDTLMEVAKEAGATAPALAEQMKWIDTNGREGRRPDLRSTLVRDYGVILRHDFAGPREAYAHMLQIAGPYNYRWGDGNGAVYYAANNRLWSYNGREDNGDEFNASNVSMFSAQGQGLGRHATDQLLANFEFAQFYRALADPAVTQKTHYHSRAMMMLRDDCLVIYDRMTDDHAPGQFTWANAWDLPQIYQIKPGVAAEDAVAHDDDKRAPATSRTIKLKRFNGQGSFLTVVAPRPIRVKATASGVDIGDDEHVFISDVPIKYDDPRTGFEGTAGYAKPGQLAIFEGSRVRLGDFSIARDGGDFAIGAVAEGGRIRGFVVGRSGGKVRITPPAGMDLARASLTIDGKPAAMARDNGEIRFEITIAQADGRKVFLIE